MLFKKAPLKEFEEVSSQKLELLSRHLIDINMDISRSMEVHRRLTKSDFVLLQDIF